MLQGSNALASHPERLLWIECVAWNPQRGTLLHQLFGLYALGECFQLRVCGGRGGL